MIEPARTNAPPLAMLASLALLSLPAAADAHALGAEAKLAGGRVHVEGYFDDDTAASDAKVWAVDEAKNTIAEGRTDAKGRWSFAAPAPGRYRVTVDAGGGHRATITVTIPPLESSEPSAPPGASAGEPVVVSEGKSREEFTRFPWLGLGGGLALITAAALLAPRVMRALRSGEPPG